MNNIIIGSTSLIGKALIRKKITFKYLKISKRTSIETDIKLDLDKISKTNYPQKIKNINTLIFLASKNYNTQNLKNNNFKKEYLWLSQIIKLSKIKNLIYLSSSSVLQKQHKVGVWKRKCEKLLIKNKKKFNVLQIWRPHNLIGVYDNYISNHFHSQLYSQIFIKKKKIINMKGPADIKISYSCPIKFSNILLELKKTNKSFMLHYRNINGISLKNIADIFCEYVQKKFKKKINIIFKNTNNKTNLCSPNKNKTLYVNENNKKLIIKFIEEMNKKYEIKKL